MTAMTHPYVQVALELLDCGGTPYTQEEIDQAIELAGAMSMDMLQVGPQPDSNDVACCLSTLEGMAIQQRAEIVQLRAELERAQLGLGRLEAQA